MRALKSRSALERLSAEERDALREAADTLVLARSSDGESRAALAGARAILVSTRGDRFEPWIEQLADDLEDTGPAPITLVSMATLTPDAPAVRKSQGSPWQ